MNTGWGPYQNLKQTVKVLINDNTKLKEEIKDLKVKLSMEESEDDDDRIIREAQERKALKNKIKTEKIKEELLIIVEGITSKYDIEIKEVEKQLSIIKAKQEQEIEEKTAYLKSQLVKYNPSEPMQIESKKRGGGGKRENLQRTEGQSKTFTEKGIKTLYFKDITIKVYDGYFTIEGRDEHYKSLNSLSVGYFTIYKNNPKGTIDVWKNMYYHDTFNEKKELIDNLRKA